MSIGQNHLIIKIMAHNNHNNKDQIWKKALSAINLGWEMALPIFLGVLLGYHLDKLTNSRFNFTISLLVLGIFISNHNLIKYIKNIDLKDE